MSIDVHLLRLSQKSFFACDVFRAAAIDTWERIGFSRTRPRLKIHETTITQNLVYEIHQLQQFAPSTLTIYESVDESANGDDLEICIRNNFGGYYTFALQAKIIYHNFPVRVPGARRLGDGHYPKMRHYVGNARLNQIDLLLAYASINGFIPLYLLYNYVFNSFPDSSLCRVNFDITQYGCSIISAQFLRNNFAIADGNLDPNISFSQLHPAIALPWFVLPCCFEKFSIDEVFDALKAKNHLMK